MSCYFKDTELFYSNLDSIDACEPIHLGITKPFINNLNRVEIYSSHGICNIINASEVISVTIFDLNGKTIINKKCKNEDLISINLSNIKKGIYIIMVNSLLKGISKNP